MKKIIIISTALLFFANFAKSQGCIIVRNVSGLGQYNLTSNSFSSSSWQISINSRYFKAYRDYKGKVDLKTPPPNQNIIRSYSMDFAVTKLLPKGWSLDLGFPIEANSRTTNSEHGGPNTPRHTTSAFGMGDLQFTVLKWLLKPTDRQKGNIQVGLGIKFPTGDYKKQGYFYRNDTTRILSTLNPAIQLGDGGTGIVAELNTYYFLDSKKIFSLYGNFYYLANPTDINGTQYTMGKPETAANILLGAYDVSSIDVFSIRAGLNYDLKNWAFSAGIRDEGAPVYDLIGKSDGIRRSGYTLSAEPGIIYKFKSATIYSYVPFLLSHEVKQSALDRIITKQTGVYTSGAGGSGDYQILVGAQFQL
jgi:hypothetical protein